MGFEAAAVLERLLMKTMAESTVSAPTWPGSFSFDVASVLFDMRTTYYSRYNDGPLLAQDYNWCVCESYILAVF